MIKPLTIMMLGGPVPFARTRVGKGTGILFTPQKQRNAAATFRVLAQQAMAQRATLDCPLRIEIIAEFPIPKSWPKKRQAAAQIHGMWTAKKPDLDNVAKLIMDSCNGIVWRDDALIVDSRVRKIYGEQPKVTLTVWELNELINDV
jgi:Holliday junction resolvase RusA-like endonuclease